MAGGKEKQTICTTSPSIPAADSATAGVSTAVDWLPDTCLLDHRSRHIAASEQGLLLALVRQVHTVCAEMDSLRWVASSPSRAFPLGCTFTGVTSVYFGNHTRMLLPAMAGVPSGCLYSTSLGPPSLFCITCRICSSPPPWCSCSTSCGYTVCSTMAAESDDELPWCWWWLLYFVTLGFGPFVVQNGFDTLLASGCLAISYNVSHPSLHRN